MTTTPVHFMSLRGVVYTRVEDITNYILECAGAEETDLRIRMEEMCHNIREGAKKHERTQASKVQEKN